MPGMLSHVKGPEQQVKSEYQKMYCGLVCKVVFKLGGRGLPVGARRGG